MKKLTFQSPLVSIDWLAENIDHPNLVVLDASIPKVGAGKVVVSENTLGIKGARLFDLKNTFKKAESNLPNTMPDPHFFSAEARKIGINQESIIVVYDNLGIYSSPRAWWMFKVMGHEKVAVLDGGFPAWKKANLPCDNIVNYTGEIGNFTAQHQAHLICDQEEVLLSIKDNQKIVLDARSNGRFWGTAPEPRADLRGGHIPQSKSLPHTEVVKEGHVISRAQLEVLFDTSTHKDKKMIFSCGSGITACVLALGAEIIGLDNKTVYDGSWSEWGADDQLPIAP